MTPKSKIPNVKGAFPGPKAKAVKLKTTISKNTNVLQYLMGYVKKQQTYLNPHPLELKLRNHV
jgi:hypothetical protein